jgi:threonine synthase
MILYGCSDCGLSYPDSGFPYLCPQCGGLFDINNLPDYQRPDQSARGIWKYKDTFGLSEDANPVTLGEGETPLIHIKDGSTSVALKLESLNPSGSYKDRPTSVLTTFLKSRGIRSAVEDSSGNAGASFAAYAARAGIKAKVFVPDTASGPKMKQIASYGAELVSVPGPRSESARKVLEIAESGVAYASHAYLPFGMAGIMTIAYELIEQLHEIPETVIVPAGHGSLLLGVIRGFEVLKNSGVIPHIPQFIGVQARACAPIWAEANHLGEVSEGNTVAEGVKVSNPIRMKPLLEYVKKRTLEMFAVDEKEIMSGMVDLHHAGVYIEPTSAIAWSAYLCKRGELKGPVLIILTGSGLKYTG